MDVVMPNNNEVALVRMAERLGAKSLCLLYDERHVEALPDVNNANINLTTAILNPKDPFRHSGLIFSNKNFRASLEHPRITHIFDLELTTVKKDARQLFSNFNQVLAKIARRKNKTLLVNFQHLLNAEPHRRSELLARIRQNLMLCNKYSVQMHICSFAANPLEMRSYRDMQALKDILLNYK